MVNYSGRCQISFSRLGRGRMISGLPLTAKSRRGLVRLGSLRGAENSGSLLMGAFSSESTLVVP